MASTRTHIEKTLADFYRKEIEQEENIWRSLPFFAATLAFQLATIFQTIEHLPRASALWWPVACALLGLPTGATITALGFLAASIYPAEFTYIAPDPDLLDYAEGLDVDETAAHAAGNTGFDADEVLTWELARQYADATGANRRVNQRRARLRSIAGLATLASVFSTITLAALVVLTYIPKDAERPDHHVASQTGLPGCAGECWRL